MLESPLALRPIDDAAPLRDAPTARGVAQGGYDVISSVDGSTLRLLGLLRHLGYELAADGTWHHTGGRTAVFTGGVATPHGTATACASLVRAMVDAGSALFALGRTEFAAITAAHAHRHVLVHANGDTDGDAPDGQDDPDDGPDGDLIDWLCTLPLWLDLPGLRVVHTCWSDFDVDALRDGLGGNCLADPQAVDAACTDGTAMHLAIRILLHGPEIALPDHAHFFDADGTRHRTAPYRWWSTDPVTYAHRAILPAGSTDHLGGPHPGFDDTPIVDPVPILFSGPPVIVSTAGHPAVPHLASPDVVCLEQQAVHPVHLVAYRWSGEAELSLANVVVA